MLKNKIISIISTIAVLFSFATVAYAEKTPLITDPTFFIEDLGEMGEEIFGLKAYAIGISYDEFGTTNPFTYEKGGTKYSPKYRGIGIKSANVTLNNFDMSKVEACVVMPDITGSAEQNGVINYTVNSNEFLNPDVEMSANGAVLFVLLTTEAVDITDVTCTELSLYMVDLGETLTNSPAIAGEWVYSANPDMVEAGAADFLAYLAPKSSDVAVESVTINKDALELDINGKTSEQLTATVLPADATDKTVTWSSDNAKITVVDGLVSLNGAAKGDTATITATAGDKSDTCTVTVVDTTPIAVESVTLDRDSIEFDLNGATDPVQLTATVLPVDAADPTVTWSSDNAKITVVDGLVSLNGAEAGDTATITATAGGKSDTCTVTVTNSAPIIPDEFDGVITHDDYAGVPEGKMIVTHSTAVTGVSADTRVSVSYNGGEARVFGTTLGEYLQLGAELTFEGKIRFAVLCNDDLDADAFAFSIIQ